jgi:hypothetical protein
MENNVDPVADDQTLLDKVTFLQNGLIAQATGSSFPGGNQAYLDLRRELGTGADVKSRLPDFVRRCRSLGEFWSFIQRSTAHIGNVANIYGTPSGTYSNTSKQKTARPV